MPYPNTLLGRLDEAIEYMRKRVPITDEQMRQIVESARRDAFWVAGTQQLGAVQAIRDSLTRAIEAGETFEAWREAIGSTLQELVTNHAQTVYRNATQTAYNEGRVKQMREPAVKRARPYLMYNAIGGRTGDGRTTTICRDLHGTIVAVDDPVVDSITPPNHHNCRSNWRALTAAQAQRFGGPTVADTSGIPDGWAVPHRSGEALLTNYPPDLVDALRRKAE